MTVHAVASVNVVPVIGPGGAHYEVPVAWTANKDNVMPASNGTTNVIIPFGLSRNEANHLIREYIAMDLYALFGESISGEDIYIPFSV